jgi:hypothetical protein
VSNSGDELFAFDFNFPASGGVKVPTAPGANLLSIGFSPSANARGTFGLYARGTPTTSEWTDAAMPAQRRRMFANLSENGGPVRIGDVLVLPGADYNRNAAVDAADYVVWRDSLNQAGAGLAADGNGNNRVDIGDYDVWRNHFGTTAASAAPGFSAAPEPPSIVFVLLATFAVTLRRHARLCKKSSGGAYMTYPYWGIDSAYRSAPRRVCSEKAC